MSNRFADLPKIPPEPAARMLSGVHTKLDTVVDAPASTPVEEFLALLSEKEAWVDVLRMLAIALPSREAVWWACIAARDIGDPKKPTPCVKAAEAWVFEPSDGNREAVRKSLENIYVDDDTDLVATAAMYAPGNMGSGDMAEYPAPAGAVSSCVFGMNMLSLSRAENFDVQMQLLIDRALDIARGGSGQIEADVMKNKAGDA
jgi:hypothetical protein